MVACRRSILIPQPSTIKGKLDDGWPNNDALAKFAALRKAKYDSILLTPIGASHSSNSFELRLEIGPCRLRE